MNLPTVVIFAVGTVLIYAAVKDKDPRHVVQDALSNKSSAPTKSSKAPSAQAPGPITIPGTAPVVTV